MQGYYLTAVMLAVCLTAVIIYLLRRDHLYLRDGLFWIVVAIGSLTLGIWPGLIDRVGTLLGIAYPPALLFLVAILILLVRALLTDITITRLRRDLRRLNQRMAMAELDLETKDDRPDDV